MDTMLWVRQWILGCSPRSGCILLVDPCIPAEGLNSKSAVVCGATYHIHVTNLSNVCKGVVEMKVKW
ncbi:hypothetical protein O9992_22175 [Vibrio lentus]|nr:hypothetical protein [Vibrio lentus]